MLKKDLAQALGVSAPMISKYVKRGMPTDSVERALRWKRRNIELGRQKGVRFDPQRAAELRDPVFQSNRLALLCLEDFAANQHELRAAMRRVPESRREEVRLPHIVFEKLLGEDVLDLLASGPGPEAEDNFPQEEIKQADDTLWRLATGEMCISHADTEGGGWDDLNI